MMKLSSQSGAVDGGQHARPAKAKYGSTSPDKSIVRSALQYRPRTEAHRMDGSSSSNADTTNNTTSNSLDRARARNIFHYRSK